MGNEKRVLIIEDDEVDAEYIMRALRKIAAEREDLTCTPQHCISFAEALKWLSDDNFDVILLDLMLPDVEAGNALQRLVTEYPDIPVIVITGLNDMNMAINSLREGAQDYVVKGEHAPRELMRIITYACERHRLKSELNKTVSQLTRKSSILKSIVDNVGDGIVVVDQDGKPRLMNAAAFKLLVVDWMEIPPEEWPMVYDPDNEAPRIVLDLPPPLVPVLRNGTIGEEVYMQSERYPEGKYISVTSRNIKNMYNTSDGCVAVLHDITKRRKAEKLKDEFVSLVSHELRTPLTSISGALGLLVGGVSGELSKEVAHMIQIAKRNSDRLIRLINDLLDVQKLEAGKLTLCVEALSVVELVQKAIEANQGLTARYNVRFDLKSSLLNNDRVMGDEDRLIQVMSNLLSNAAKYAPENTRVIVSLEKRNVSSIRISVKDNGPGISEDFKPFIFGKFSQAEGTTTRQKEGTGLGLNIARSIVELHNGEIGFDSTEGDGATFFVVLPMFQPLSTNGHLAASDYTA